MKREVRKRTLTILENLSKESRIRQQNNLYNQLFKQSCWIKANSIAVTISKFPEIETNPIIQRAWKEHKSVYVPKIVDEKMIFVQLTYKTLCIPNNFGILEPIDTVECWTGIDLIIVPGVAFNLRTNQRIGFGGGYYDKFLSTFQGHTIALAFQEQITAFSQFEYYDIAVQQILVAYSGENNE